MKNRGQDSVEINTSAPIDALRPSDVLGWIAVDPETRGPLMVDALPRTLDGKRGQLTYGFLDRTRSVELDLLLTGSLLAPFTPPSHRQP